MDIVYIRGLTISATVGVYDWERTIKQEINVDLEMGYDNVKAGLSDDLEFALDYKAVSDRTTAYVEASSFYLVEAIAENLATVLLAEFPIEWLKIRVGKPDAISQAADVGVYIERSRLT